MYIAKKNEFFLSCARFSLTLRSFEREITLSRQKKEQVSLFCSRLFVTLRSFEREITLSRQKKEQVLFVTLPINRRNYSVSAKKKEQVSLFCSRLFVTLEEFAEYLYIKALQRIENFWGYDLETVLNSMFCYKLPKRAPDSEPPPVSWLVVGCKGRHNISHHQIFNHLY